MNRYVRIFLVFLVCLYFFYYISTYTEWHFIDNVNLIFHEAGHTIFFFLGQFMSVVMGSGFQILLPLVLSGYFFISHQKLSGSLCLLWVGQNILNVSVYLGDALLMQLPLLGGDGVVHDWNFILNSLGWLRYTDSIARCVYWIGVGVIAYGGVMSLYYANQIED